MLKTGKISETVLKRSVLKQIKKRRKEVLIGAGVGADCSAIELFEGEVLVTSIDPITITDIDIAHLAINVTANDIATSGAENLAVMVSILLPEGYEEAELKRIMSSLEKEAAEINVQIIGGHTEITDAVTRPVITVCGYGKVPKDKLISIKGAKPGDDVVVTKWVGLEGTSIIAKKKEEELKKRFSSSFVDEAKSYSEYISVIEEARIAGDLSAHAMHDITEGGVFGALWELAEGSGCGLSINLLDIPLKQQTVEICEEYLLNPYELISSGSLLIAAENGEDIVRKLNSHNINAAVIGKITEGNDRLLINGDEKRFLEPPKTDEIYKLKQY